MKEAQSAIQALYFTPARGLNCYTVDVRKPDLRFGKPDENMYIYCTVTGFLNPNALLQTI